MEMTETATELPSLNYFNNELKEQMNSFTSFFNQKISQGENDLVLNKDKFMILIDDLIQQENDLKNQMIILEDKAVQLEKENNDNIEEFEQAKLQNEELQAQKEQYELSKQELISKIEDLNKQLTDKRKELSHMTDELRENKRLTLLECNKFETYLGLTIEPVKLDLMEFKFANTDINDYNRIISFTLDVSGEKSQVAETNPKLPDDVLQLIQQRFDQHRDLGKFLKEMRSALAKV